MERRSRRDLFENFKPGFRCFVMVAVRRFAILLLVTAAYGCGSHIAGPDAANKGNCGLSAISPAPAISCAPVTPGCPGPRPTGARTLVAVFACVFPTDTTPCAIHASVCPILESDGLPMRFIVSDRETACVSAVDVTLRPSVEGGVRIEWIAQERTLMPEGCLLGAQFNGSGNVTGPCCATTTDISLPTERKTLRLTVQADWQR